MKEAYIVSAARTPIGSFGGSLAGFTATQLGAEVVKAAVSRAGLTGEQVEEVFMGNVIAAGLGQAPARQTAIYAGLGYHVPCTTINKVCASGMKAVMFAAQSIMSGQNDIIIAGGMESMSNVPYYIPKARYGYKYGNGEILDGLVYDGLTDRYQGCAMGVCADATATKYEISREEQDAYAIQSYKRAAEATAEGRFKNEITPIAIPQKKGDPVMMVEDEEYKNVFFDKIPTLKPVFTKDGSVTAANASTINDGAAALAIVSGEQVKALNLKPLARIVSFADAAQAPEWFTTAPVPAAERALKKAGLNLGDIDYFEVNEAFSVVALAFIKQLGLDQAKVNVNGGAVSIGHPLGCSGARIITTLVNVLHQRNGKYGLAAICNGGGGASALIVERV
ncbi:thiolase family protein [Rhodoflexus caldus]|uniref:thiolase family protein n=1 Tax=Rhodoflexus caldus TaxID=2891236 RepID=UPI00202A8951|nr:thiolase family protein [Rhodoflexus caldus]